MGSERNETKRGVSAPQLDSRPVILLTGFGPFANYKENPAWLALEALRKRCNDDLPDAKINFVFRMIPVEYGTVIDTMPAWWEELKPRAIIHVGAGLADCSIHVEKRAYNRGYCCKDVIGDVPCDNCYAHDGPLHLESELDVDAIVQEINSKVHQLNGLRPAKVSTNPGRFLCSFIYYQSLHRYSRRSLFIHVPPIDDGSCITAETLAQGLKLVILAVVRQLGLND